MWLSRWISGNGRNGQAIESARHDGNGAGQHAAAADIPDVRWVLPQIFAEFRRARRYERTLTVAVFTPERARDDVERRGARVGRASSNDAVMAAALASALREAMRETDLVAWESATRRSVVVMPEIGIEDGRKAVERMRDLCVSRLAYAVRVDIAEFPADGWTFEELLAVAPRRDESNEAGEGHRASHERQGGNALPVGATE